MSGFDDLVASISVGVAVRPLDVGSLPRAVADAMPAQPDAAVVALDAAAAFAALHAAEVRSVRPGGPVLLPEHQGRRADPAVDSVVLRLLSEQKGGTGDRLVSRALVRLAEREQFVGEVTQLALLPRLAKLDRPPVATITERVLRAAETDPDLAGAAKRMGSRPEQLVEPSWKGSLAQREAFLRQERGSDPAGARELFQTWLSGRTRAGERRRLVACLEVGLSMADEPLLEQMLHDDAETAVETSRLLRRLPDSRLMERLRQAAMATVHHVPSTWLKPGTTAYVDLTTDPDLQRDIGLERGWKSWRPFALTAELIGVIPTGWWPSMAGSKASDVIIAAPREDAQAVQAGWLHAAANSADADLATWFLGQYQLDAWQLEIIAPALGHEQAANAAAGLMEYSSTESVRGLLRPLFPTEVPPEVVDAVVQHFPSWNGGHLHETHEVLEYLVEAASPDQLRRLLTAVEGASTREGDGFALKRFGTDLAHLRLALALDEAVEASLAGGGFPWDAARPGSTDAPRADATSSEATVSEIGTPGGVLAPTDMPTITTEES